ncbi:MAG TPA: hypothetical protein VIH57_18260 [Bacteroidales bacterium]
MEPRQKSQRANFADREKVKINKKLLIYLFFLLISIGLWYLNALSKDYITSIHYPVRYENFPKGKALVSDMPEELAIKVKGLGFSVLKHKLLAYTRHIDLPVGNFRLDIIRKVNQYDYCLSTRYIREWVGNQLGSDIQLIGIEPDTLVFEFADVVDKKVPVKPVLNLQFEKQYMQTGPTNIRPDSVVVSGPQALIDTLRCIYTKEFRNKSVKDTFKRDIELMPFSRITCKVPSVSVIVPVEKYTELNIAIPVESINTPEGLRVRTFPGTVTVSCWVGVSSYDKMTPYMFRAVVDYDAIIADPQSKARIDLVRTPSNIQNIRFYPKSAEYIIEK